MAMNIFSLNIKLLRKRRGRTQDDMATTLEMKRSTLSGYENEVAQPGIEALLAIAAYFNVAVDTLLKIDLSKLKESELRQLERGYDVFVSGSTLRVLTTTVDSKNNENIELVNQKASAGYRTGFADPEYISVLPTFQMPFLSRERKYRTFQITGDSMLPIPDGSWITGEFVQNWNLIREGQAHIILTLNDGIVFKVIGNQMDLGGNFRLLSLNPSFEPYDISVKDVKEIWKFVHYISAELPEPNLQKNEIVSSIETLTREVEKLKTQLSWRQGKLPFDEV